MIGLTFFASGFAAATALCDFLYKDYASAIVMTIISIVNLILGVNC
jgi:hypothetical protein